VRIEEASRKELSRRQEGGKGSRKEEWRSTALQTLLATGFGLFLSLAKGGKGKYRRQGGGNGSGRGRGGKQVGQ